MTCGEGVFGMNAIVKGIFVKQPPLLPFINITLGSG